MPHIYEALAKLGLDIAMPSEYVGNVLSHPLWYICQDQNIYLIRTIDPKDEGPVFTLRTAQQATAAFFVDFHGHIFNVTIGNKRFKTFVHNTEGALVFNEELIAHVKILPELQAWIVQTILGLNSQSS